MRNGYKEGKFKEGIVMKANEAQEQYISKSTLVAELKKRQREHDEKKYDYASSDHFWASVEDGKILSLIDTLEVKEVGEEPYVMSDKGKFTTTTK